MAELVLGAAVTASKLFLESNPVSIDNLTFKLFYKATTTLLIGCSFVATSKQFFGEPISCDLRAGRGGIDVSEKVINSFCWMYASFDIAPDFSGTCARRENDGNDLYNTYYQWVAIYLVIQAVIFYVPRMIWLSLEGGLMTYLVRGARGKVIEDVEDKKLDLLKTFQEHLHNQYHKYAFAFFGCEILNLLVVITQIAITNVFLNYTFLTYGIDVYGYYRLPHEERKLMNINPMCEAFPRVASCTYKRYGGGGNIEKKNALCVLGLNMVNDKIFLVIWIWYYFVLCNSIFRFFYRIAQLLSSRLRFLLIKMKMHRYFKRTGNTRHIEHYILNCSIGDWFVLYQMSRNMNRRFFAEFITILSKRVNPHPDEECDEAPFFHHCHDAKCDQHYLLPRTPPSSLTSDKVDLSIPKSATTNIDETKSGKDLTKNTKSFKDLTECCADISEEDLQFDDSTEAARSAKSPGSVSINEAVKSIESSRKSSINEPMQSLTTSRAMSRASSVARFMDREASGRASVASIDPTFKMGNNEKEDDATAKLIVGPDDLDDPWA